MPENTEVKLISREDGQVIRCRARAGHSPHRSGPGTSPREPGAPKKARGTQRANTLQPSGGHAPKVEQKRQPKLIANPDKVKGG
jgi:hypothetical protein